ncbi:amidohydrolase family protein [Microtetraspora sp. NBRC 13810]|uniref:amidohydrolase family protein n=1 Tax=Microtetraspora sp. NBRC 13810 TaxID=3030990 RepID=UPI002556F77C|nr:amidohydrolase family protein [Microtetraspora sp. NBRC 13810]
MALEEAFWFDGLTTAGSFTGAGRVTPYRPEAVEGYTRKLTDFTEYRLPEMDEHGIDVQVLSLTSPGVQMQPDAGIAVDDARRANDFLAETIARHPTRFAGLAALPLQDPERAAAELRRAVTSLGLHGALVNDHTLGHYLDEEPYDVVWAELEALGVPLYLHPNAVPVDRWRVLEGHPELEGASFSWAAATGGHAMRLVYAGVFDRFPGVTVILGHNGEFLPYQLTRFDSRHRQLALSRPLARTPSQYLRDNFMITTSGVYSHAALVAAVQAMGVDNVMFAIDYPYESTAEAAAFLDGAPFAPDDLARIAHGNADRVLRLSPAPH